MTLHKSAALLCIFVLQKTLAYTNKSVHIIEPMLGRLNKCRDSILIATDNELDILAEEEYARIKGYFDYMRYREEEVNRDC